MRTSRSKALFGAKTYLIFGGVIFVLLPFHLENILLLMPGIVLLITHKFFDNIDIRIASIILDLFRLIFMVIVVLVLSKFIQW